jgi:FMN phosphatase YigB (HAD superfamily)
MAAYRGVLLDLFGTLIAFDREQIPELEIDGARVRTTVAGLTGVLGEYAPGVPTEEFFRALVTVSEEMARARVWDHVELPSRERFRRALERVGCDDAVLAEASVHCSRVHMAMIAAATVLPDGHARLLTDLRRRYRLALVSNFDDTAAAYDILHRHGLLPLLETVVISDALGLRKPHPALVRAALRGLGLAPSEALFVGNSWPEDVGAARAAGVDAAWIDATGQGVPDGAPAPRWLLRTLLDLAQHLA